METLKLLFAFSGLLAAAVALDVNCNCFIESEADADPACCDCCMSLNSKIYSENFCNMDHNIDMNLKYYVSTLQRNPTDPKAPLGAKLHLVTVTPVCARLGSASGSNNSVDGNNVGKRQLTQDNQQQLPKSAAFSIGQIPSTNGNHHYHRGNINYYNNIYVVRLEDIPYIAAHHRLQITTLTPTNAKLAPSADVGFHPAPAEENAPSRGHLAAPGGQHLETRDSGHTASHHQSGHFARNIDAQQLTNSQYGPPPPPADYGQNVRTKGNGNIIPLRVPHEYHDAPPAEPKFAASYDKLSEPVQRRNLVRYLELQQVPVENKIQSAAVSPENRLLLPVQVPQKYVQPPPR